MSQGTQITPPPPSFVYICLCQSKTDSFSAGVNIYLGRTGHPTNPVAALLVFLPVCPADPRAHFFVFAMVLLSARTDQCWRFAKFFGCMALTIPKTMVIAFKFGAAPSAGAVGVPNHAIKMLGRRDSSAYLCLYTSSPVSWVFAALPSPFGYPTTQSNVAMSSILI